MRSWLLVALIAFACAEGEEPRTTPAPTPTELPLARVAVTLEVDKDTYAVGEPIPMTLTVANVRAQPITLYYRDAQRFDFFVVVGDQEVWRWSADQLFAQVLGQETLAPGQYLVYRLVWYQQDAQGQPVPPGTYTLYGESTGCLDPDLVTNCRQRSNPFPFTVR